MLITNTVPIINVKACNLALAEDKISDTLIKIYYQNLQFFLTRSNRISCYLLKCHFLIFYVFSA
jgi:hypothetical protein